jgi:hypothetical protein
MFSFLNASYSIPCTLPISRRREHDEAEERFADFLCVLISGGFLEIEGFRLPSYEAVTS